MPISTIANCSGKAASPQRGFTLVEILVVVTLVAVFAAVLIPNLHIGSERELDQGAVRLQELLEAVGEQSVFSGELLGVRLKEDRIEPMRFDPEQQKFAPFGGDSRVGLGNWDLGDDLRLSWELEKVEQDGSSSPFTAGFGLVEAAEARLTAGEKDDDKDSRPQLFFFPSGEATPAHFKLELIGSDRMPVELELDALSRATLIKDEEE